MKTNFWKRAAALLLALVLCFACVGTVSAAEDVSGKVYLISYPRDGDENYHTGSWGHDALYFRHGWKLSASDYLDVRAIESYSGDLVCKDCGQTLEKGETLPKTGHKYVNGVCSVCGRKFGAPTTADGFALPLTLAAAIVSLIALAILVLVRKRKDTV